MPKIQIFFDLDPHGIKVCIHQQETIKLASFFLGSRQHFNAYQCTIDESDGPFVVKKSLVDIMHAFSFMQDVLRTTKSAAACTDGVRIRFDGGTSAICVGLNASIATSSPFECQYMLKGEHFDPGFYQNLLNIRSMGEDVVVKTVLRSNLFVNCIAEVVGGTLDDAQVEFNFNHSTETNPFVVSVYSSYATSEFSISVASVNTTVSLAEGNSPICELYQCVKEMKIKIDGKKLVAFRELLKCSTKVSLILCEPEERGSGELFLAQLMIPFGSGAIAFVEYELMYGAS